MNCLGIFICAVGLALSSSAAMAAQRRCEILLADGSSAHLSDETKNLLGFGTASKLGAIDIKSIADAAEDALNPESLQANYDYHVAILDFKGYPGMNKLVDMTVALNPPLPGTKLKLVFTPRFDTASGVGFMLAQVLNHANILTSLQALEMETGFLLMNLQRLEANANARLPQATVQQAVEILKQGRNRQRFENDYVYMGRLFLAYLQVKGIYVSWLSRMNSSMRAALASKVLRQRRHYYEPAWIADPGSVLSHPWFWGARDSDFSSYLRLFQIMSDPTGSAFLETPNINHATPEQLAALQDSASPTEFARWFGLVGDPSYPADAGDASSDYFSFSSLFSPETSRTGLATVDHYGDASGTSHLPAPAADPSQQSGIESGSGWSGANVGSTPTSNDTGMY